MDAAQIPLTVAVFALTVAGSFLYNDGHRNHHLAGLMATGLGFVLTAVSGAVDSQQRANEELGCLLNGRPSYCTVQELGPWNYLWQRMIEPFALEVMLAVLAWFVGWFIAKMTPQAPTDGRKQAVFGPPDDA